MRDNRWPNNDYKAINYVLCSCNEQWKYSYRSSSWEWCQLHGSRTRISVPFQLWTIVFPPSIPQETGNMNKYAYHHNIKENYTKLFSCPLQFHYLHILALDHFIDSRWRNTSSGHPAASQRTWEAWLTSRCSSSSGLDLHSTHRSRATRSICKSLSMPSRGGGQTGLPEGWPTQVLTTAPAQNGEGVCLLVEKPHRIPQDL